MKFSDESQLEALLDSRLAQAREGAERCNEGLVKGLAICESPVERLFLVHLLNIAGEVIQIDIGEEMPYHYLFRNITWKLERFRYRIKPQHVIDSHDLYHTEKFRYRADFLLTIERDEPHGEDIQHLQLVVEIDGHDFHDRTKEQAQRDRERDRNLSAIGYQVIRYTGSEIYTNGERLANQLLDRLEHESYQVVRRLGV